MGEKISGMTAVSSVVGTDEFEINHSGATRRANAAQIAAYTASVYGLMARAKTATNIDYADSTETIINFATVEYDPGSDITTGASWKYTVPAPGEYEPRITSALVRSQGAAWSDGDYVQINVYLNGSVVDTLAFYQSPGTASTSAWYQLQGGRSFACAAGDEIDCQFQNASGATRRLSSGARVEIYRVA